MGARLRREMMTGRSITFAGRGHGFARLQRSRGNGHHPLSPAYLLVRPGTVRTGDSASVTGFAPLGWERRFGGLCAAVLFDGKDFQSKKGVIYCFTTNTYLGKIPASWWS